MAEALQSGSRPFQDPPRRILLACTQRIGDVLLATPLARSMKRAWPAAALDMLVFDDTEAVLEGNPDINRVIAVPRRAGLRERYQELRRLWRHYDLAVSPLPTDRSRLYCWVAATRSIGLLRPERKERAKSLLLSAWGEFDDLDTHTVAMGLRLAQMLGIPPSFEVVPPGISSGQLDALLAKLLPLQGKPYVVLHPYPKFAYKMWPRAAWLELADWLQGRGLALAFTGGPAPEERAYVGDIALRAGGLDLSGRLSLAETAELIGRAALYVGPDTAVTHIAAATGAPTIALFGPSNPVKWGPWPRGWASLESPWGRRGSGRRGNVFLMQGPGECVPCMQEGCERKVDSGSECLRQLGAGQVVLAAEALLQAPVWATDSNCSR